MLKDSPYGTNELPQTSENIPEAIAVQSTLWSQLPDVDKVPKFSDSDAECLRELRDVLKKHNQLERFGIALLHKHFEIADDEVLFETTDVDKRTQYIRPVKMKDYIDRKDMTIMATCLKLVEGEPITQLRCICFTSANGHERSHGYVPGG